MAKVRGAFGGFGTAGQIGKAYVFFIWKGINAIRTWVIPNNPNSGNQQTQRNNFKALVAQWHDGLFNVLDAAAYERAAGTVKYKPQSGFNRFIGLYRAIFKSGATPSRCHGLTVSSAAHAAFTAFITTEAHQGAGTDLFQWGTSPTSLFHVETPTFMTLVLTVGPFDTGFGAGTVIYYKFVSKQAAVPYLNYMESGIYKTVLT